MTRIQAGSLAVRKRVVIELEKMQTRLRRVSDWVPLGPDLPALTPAAPQGEDFERFQDEHQALCSWHDKQTQWWYFTGHLRSQKTGQPFGFQVVFFERHANQDFIGVVPTRWMFEEFFVAHFGLCNPQAKTEATKFQCFQRGGILSEHTGVSSEDNFHIEVDGWHAFRKKDGTLVLHASAEGSSLHLELQSEKPLSYHGRNGYFQKDRRAEDSSLYCSYTRLKGSGKLTVDGEVHEVDGSCWMDHEKMSSDDRIFHRGWDWYSIQLSNQEELMLYALKDARGRKSSFAGGTLIQKDGKAISIASGEMFTEVLSAWQSPRTKAVYPVSQRIRIPKHGIDLVATPLMPEQEMDTSKTAFISYWEGAMNFEGHRMGEPVTGQGYLELVGYDDRPKIKLFKFITLPGEA